MKWNDMEGTNAETTKSTKATNLNIITPISINNAYNHCGCLSCIVGAVLWIWACWNGEIYDNYEKYIWRVYEKMKREI